MDTRVLNWLCSRYLLVVAVIAESGLNVRDKRIRARENLSFVESAGQDHGQAGVKLAKRRQGFPAVGHPIGDRVLVAVAKHLKDMVRTSDTLGRFGGEEFVILLPDTQLGAAQVAAER